MNATIKYIDRKGQEIKVGCRVSFSVHIDGHPFKGVGTVTDTRYGAVTAKDPSIKHRERDRYGSTYETDSVFISCEWDSKRQAHIAGADTTSWAQDWPELRRNWCEVIG